MHLQCIGQQCSKASSVCCGHKDLTIWHSWLILEGRHNFLPRPQSIVPANISPLDMLVLNGSLQDAHADTVKLFALALEVELMVTMW